MLITTNKIEQCHVIENATVKEKIRLLVLLWSPKKETFKLRYNAIPIKRWERECEVDRVSNRNLRDRCKVGLFGRGQGRGR